MNYNILNCIICGKKKGRGFNHEKCSRALKEKMKGSGENKKPVKRMQDGGNKAADYINHNFT